LEKIAKKSIFHIFDFLTVYSYLWTNFEFFSSQWKARTFWSRNHWNFWKKFKAFRNEKKTVNFFLTVRITVRSFFGQKINSKNCQNCYDEDGAGLFTVLESLWYVLSKEPLKQKIRPKNFVYEFLKRGRQKGLFYPCRPLWVKRAQMTCRIRIRKSHYRSKFDPKISSFYKKFKYST